MDEITTRIYQARCAFIEAHRGDEPNVIYLGRLDERDLYDWCDDNKSEAPVVGRYKTHPEIMGMMIFVVYEDRHLFVAKRGKESE